jgi:group I intron endonuclease
MDNNQTKKDLIREYKDRTIYAGVFQIKNTVNNKVFLGSTTNLEGIQNSQMYKLAEGFHKNKQLQKEFAQFGKDNFVFEILETIEVKNDPDFNLDDELTLLEQIWLEKLNPVGDKGYNTEGKVRMG